MQTLSGEIFTYVFRTGMWTFCSVACLVSTFCFLSFSKYDYKIDYRALKIETVSYKTLAIKIYSRQGKYKTRKDQLAVNPANKIWKLSSSIK